VPRKEGQGTCRWEECGRGWYETAGRHSESHSMLTYEYQCDGRRPACERCERQGRSCPGYRDLGGVIFRDENSRIVRRVAKKYGNKPLAAPSASLASPAASASATATFDNDHDGSPALQVPVSMVSARLGPNEGVCYFHQEFCWETVPLYAGSWAGPSSTLANATGAIGLAMLSFKRRSTSLAQEAFAEYGTAMHVVNRELSNPATALSDSTLAIVVLMSFFEVSCCPQHILTACVNIVGQWQELKKITCPRLSPGLVPPPWILGLITPKGQPPSSPCAAHHS
jgi:hypothetical protein